MPESRSHKTTANRIARKLGGEYNAGQGADVKAGRATVEVETADTVGDATRQLQGHRGPVYIAGANREAVERALAVTDGTTIGVMDNQANVLKPSTRKR